MPSRIPVEPVGRPVLLDARGEPQCLPVIAGGRRSRAAERRRILLVGDTLNLGGTEGQFVEIACGLSRSGWDVEASCLRAEGPLQARLQAAGVRPWSCGGGSFRSPRLLGAVWGLCRYLRSRRISLVHSFDFYSNILAVLAARLARAPVIIASQRDLGNLRPRAQQALHRRILRLAQYVLVNSPAVAERVRLALPVGGTRVALVPNGVDVERFTPIPRSARPATVGTLANLRPEKGLADLVRAAAILRDREAGMRFLVWGDGPLRRDLERLARDLGAAIDFRGATRIPEYALHECDIFVLPSLSEACSNVLLEAMASGLPVVATRVGGNPALVEEGKTGFLVPPGNPRALAEAIARLAGEPALAAAFGARARERVLTEFSIPRLLERVETLYEQALARRAV